MSESCENSSVVVKKYRKSSSDQIPVNGNDMMQSDNKQTRSIYSESTTIPLKDCDEDSVLSRGNKQQFGSKRIQQLWCAVKRIKNKQSSSTSSSPILSRKNCKPEERCRKFSIGYEKDHIVIEPAHHHHQQPNSKIFRSPFHRRRDQSNNSSCKTKRHYSSHPDIRSSHKQFTDENNVNNADKNNNNEFNSKLNGAVNNVESLSKFQKIKKDMRRCVQRTNSSDYNLNGNIEIEPAGQQQHLCKSIINSETETINQITKRNAILNTINDIKLFSRCKTPKIEQKTESKVEVELPTIAKVDEEEMILRVETLENCENNDKLVASPTEPTWNKKQCTEITLENAQNYESVIHRQRISKLLQYPFFQVDINIRSASNLLAKDACGTSDPYVKFKTNNQIVFKSRTVYKSLNPKWDEYFSLPVNDIFEPIMLKVYDHDHFFTDDYLGTALIDLTKLEPGMLTELELFLHESEDPEKANVDENWGKIFLTVKLNPKTQEEKEHFYGRGKCTITSSGNDGPGKKIKSQLWESVVNVLLICGGNINLDTDYCIRFKLSNEKYKSKVVSKAVREPVWTENFDMHIFTGQSKMLEIYLCASSNQNDYIDKIIVDLDELEIDKTHKLIQRFRGSIHSTLELLVTVTGTALSKASGSMELGSNNFDICSKLLVDIDKRYNFIHSLKKISDVGQLLVKVYKAESLASADINGKSDPLCVLELVNDRLQTSTLYKTLSPEWNKTFTFNVKDIHSVLEVTIYDEDRAGVEFLGKVAIPLLKIKNGEKKWYALKDKKLHSRAKGHILLEFFLSFNKFKASIRTFNPRETRYIQPEVKFKRSIFLQNASRIKSIILELMDIGNYITSCYKWEKPLRTIVTFALSLTSIYYFELYMLPFLLLLLLLQNYCRQRFWFYWEPNAREEEYQFLEENVCSDDDDDDNNSGNNNGNTKEEKKSLKERLQAVQDTLTIVMVILGNIASYIERVKNVANFSVPFLSWLAIICMVIITVILYFIPIRYIVMAWCINKFTKKLRAPNAINNNELIDYLSRVPDMQEKIIYREYKPTISRGSNFSADQSSMLPAHASSALIQQQCTGNSKKQFDRTISTDSSGGSPNLDKKKNFTSNKKSK